MAEQTKNGFEPESTVDNTPVEELETAAAQTAEDRRETGKPEQPYHRPPTNQGSQQKVVGNVADSELPEGRRNKGKTAQNPWQTLVRLVKMLFGFYPVLLPVMLLLLIVGTIASTFPNVFMQRTIEIVGKLASRGMVETDKEIIRLMMEN